MKQATILALSLGLMFGGATAVQASPADLFAKASADEKAAKPKPSSGRTTVRADGKICKSDIKSGSRLPGRKICLTQAEWDFQAKTARESIDDISRRSLANPTIN